MEVKEIFINRLKDSKNEVSKDDILKVACEYGLELKPRTARDKIIDIIVEHGAYEKLYEYFCEFITFPFWEVADFYNMSSQQITRLKEIGVIKEQPIEKEFYSRQGKSYFKADTYPISIFDYDEQALKQAYENAYGGDMYSFRIETKTKEEVKLLINILEKDFKVEYSPKSYEHRNEQGFYTYIKVKLLNGTQEEQNRFLNEISDLKKKIKQNEEEYKQRIDKLYTRLEKYLGEGIRNNIILDKKLQSLVDGIEIKKNTRGAGRKPKFDKNKILEMEIMKENGYSYSQIAKEYNTTKVTVIKYLKHRKVKK